MFESLSAIQAFAAPLPLIRVFAATTLILQPMRAPSAAAGTVIVVELFTSQGCSACPAADALLGELAARSDVLALSMHVDYWDYLGWKDRFASPANAARQRDYARALGVKYVYTPQIVIQGQAHIAGGDREAVLRAIEAAPPAPVTVALQWAGRQRLVIHIGGQPRGVPANVWLVLFDNAQSTQIGSGENTGRQLINYNVVRGLRAVGRWTGEATDVFVDMTRPEDAGENCGVILQAEDGGPVVGAARCGSPPG